MFVINETYINLSERFTMQAHKHENYVEPNTKNYKSLFLCCRECLHLLSTQMIEAKHIIPFLMGPLM